MTDAVVFRTKEPSSAVEAFNPGWIQWRMGLMTAKDGYGASISMLISMYVAVGEGTLNESSGVT